MFSFFKKKKQEPTFKGNVEDFWTWFANNAARFKETIDQGKCADLLDETSSAISKMIPKIGWCYGPGEGEGRHALTLSPEADRDHQFLAEYWISRKPEIPDWDFYPAKKGGDLSESYSINTGGYDFGVDEIWVSTEIDTEDEKIVLTAWHHHFYELEENARYRVSFILLDELLGEYDVQNYIYLKEFTTEKLADSIPLMELSDFLESVKKEYGWHKPSPCETYCTYKLPGEEKVFPRSDAFVGSTCHFDLIRDYFTAKSELEDPLKGSLAEYVFIRLDNSLLPEGEEVNFRADIEDKIEAVLLAEKSGRSFGGSQGSEYAYIDFLLYDGQNSIDLVLQEMKTAGLPGGTTLHFWARGKEVLKL